MKHIGSTVGLEVNGHGFIGKMVQIHYYRNSDRSVSMKSISGRNLGEIPRAGVKTVSEDVFADRPSNPYNSTREAIWALHACGWELMSEGDEDE